MEGIAQVVTKKQHDPSHRSATTEKGVPISKTEIEQYMRHLLSKGCVAATIECYRHNLTRLHDTLPDNDKNIYRGTLEDLRQQMLSDGYAPSTINGNILIANGYLEYMGRREYQLVGQLEKANGVQPEISRTEYLHLLQTAKLLGQERTYLLIKLFGNTEFPPQELSAMTVEAARQGKISIVNFGIKQMIRLPECLCKEMLNYCERNGIYEGPVFVTNRGKIMTRSNINKRITDLCEKARISPERGAPTSLKRMYRTMQEQMERNIRAIVEQAYERQLEQEQLSVGWEE